MGHCKVEDSRCGTLNALRDTCDCGETHWPRVRSLGLDPLHRLILDVARCCCGGYATDQIKLWDFALYSAMNSLGVAHGAAVFGHVASVSKTVRMERDGMFEFLTVRCSRITPDEQQFMQSVIHAVDGSAAELQSAVLQLVRSHKCAATLVALDALGAACRTCEWYRRTPPDRMEESRALH